LKASAYKDRIYLMGMQSSLTRSCLQITSHKCNNIDVPNAALCSMFAKLVILKKPNQTNKMKTNWIILVAVLVGAIALVISLIIRNKKDEKEVMKSFNAEDDIEGDETAQRKGEE